MTLDTSGQPSFQFSPDARLRKQLVDHFNLEELRTLCHDLGMDYENVAGQTKDVWVREFILYCQRKNQIANLILACQEKRPFLPWDWYPIDQPEPSAPEMEAAIQRYFRYLRERHGFLELHSMGIGGRMPTHLPLVELYLPLLARGELPDGETWLRETIVDDQENEASLLDRQEQLSEPQPLVEFLQSYDGLIVLGDPGSGKTTFLKYVALQLASGNGSALGLTNWLPIILPLAAYARTLAEQDHPLSDFIVTYYDNRGIDLPFSAILTDKLAQGNVLFLLDGLDEVSDVDLRHLLLRRLLDFFTFQRQQGNKFVVTSRLVGYRDVRQLAEGLVECTLIDLSEDAVARFIGQWANVVGNIDASKLQTAVLQNHNLRQLASNPLLLTILLLMQHQGREISEQRVILYDQYLETLLDRWVRMRGLDGSLESRLEKSIVQQILPQLARWMQEMAPSVGLVHRRVLLRQLRQICTELGLSQSTAQHFLVNVRQQAGVLVERGLGEFGFIHRTFQEYLTAVSFAQHDPKTMAATLLSHVDEDSWREIILLTFSYLALIERRPADVVFILRSFLAAESATKGQSVIIAGQALLDLDITQIESEVQTAVNQSLQTMLEESNRFEPIVRTSAGRILAQLGDPRTAVMTTAAMPFCYIPGGSFWLGEGKAGHEHNQLQAAYWLAKYPVSQAQYSEFVVAGGYNEARYWPEALAVGRWRAGEAQDWENRGWRKRPFDFADPFTLPNHPVVGISWYEATAFTRWLTEQWHEEGWLPRNWQVRLPSEAQWEKGARGGLQVPVEPIIRSVEQLSEMPTVEQIANSLPQRRFPWGESTFASLEQVANFRLSGFATTNSLGCYSTGQSVYGCEAMAGNVWEWTRSLHRPYPYDKHDGREKTAVKLFDNIVLRGGAYWTEQKRLRCSARVRRSPNDRNSSYGFRVVIEEMDC